QIALVGYRDRFAHVVGRHADHIGRGGDCAWHAVLNDNGDVESTIIEELILRKQVATKLARRFRQVSFVDNKSGAVLSGLCSINEILIADNFHRPTVLKALLADAFSSGLSLAAQTYDGWFIGTGFEYAFTWLPINGLFLKTEFRYSQYGGNNGVSVPLTGSIGGIPIGPGAALNSQKATEFVSTELVWRFNWFGGRY